MTEINKKEIITLPEVKEILQQVKPDEMDQIQRWTFDFVTRFSKIDAKTSRKMVEEQMRECELKEEEAVELVNILPGSLEELRSFTFGWKKLILTNTLEKMLEILKQKAES
jgi:DNA-directed RNA polymerase subunit F